MAHHLSSALLSSSNSSYNRSAQTTLWRGTLSVTGMRTSDRNSTQQLHVTAVETDGESRMDLWPHQLFAYTKYNLPVLREFLAWINHNNPPTCTYMPTNFADANNNAINQSNFRSLSRILYETQTIAVAAWNVDSIPGAGIIFYPAQNSSAMLVGALFLHNPFPDFVLAVPSPIQMPSAGMQQRRQVSYSHIIGAASPYSITHPRSTSSPTSSDTQSPIDPSYPYLVPPVSGGYRSQTQSPSSMAAGYDVGYPYTRAESQQRYV